MDESWLWPSDETSAVELLASQTSKDPMKQANAMAYDYTEITIEQYIG
jgi:hypothetical protein